MRPLRGGGAQGLPKIQCTPMEWAFRCIRHILAEPGPSEVPYPYMFEEVEESRGGRWQGIGTADEKIALAHCCCAVAGYHLKAVAEMDCAAVSFGKEVVTAFHFYDVAVALGGRTRGTPLDTDLSEELFTFIFDSILLQRQPQTKDADQAQLKRRIEIYTRMHNCLLTLVARRGAGGSPLVARFARDQIDRVKRDTAFAEAHRIFHAAAREAGVDGAGAPAGGAPQDPAILAGALAQVQALARFAGGLASPHLVRAEKMYNYSYYLDVRDGDTAAMVANDIRSGDFFKARPITESATIAHLRRKRPSLSALLPSGAP